MGFGLRIWGWTQVVGGCTLRLLFGLWGSGIVDSSQGFWVELMWLGFGLIGWGSKSGMTVFFQTFVQMKMLKQFPWRNLGGSLFCEPV